jgi:hypothetical protein
VAAKIDCMTCRRREKDAEIKDRLSRIEDRDENSRIYRRKQKGLRWCIAFVFDAFSEKKYKASRCRAAALARVGSSSSGGQRAAS